MEKLSSRISDITDRPPNFNMLPIKRIRFKRATSSGSEDKVERIITGESQSDGLTGKEAQDFYERVISTPSSNEDKIEKPQRGPISGEGTDQDQNRKREQGNPRDASKLLKLAQEGKLMQMKRFFCDQEVCDVDAVDSFGWTALMCSACAGHSAVVQYLLEKGANRNLINRQGQTAYDLAKAKEASKVMQILKSWNDEGKHKWPSGLGESRPVIHEKKTRNKFFCVACARYFAETTVLEHQTSTVHLFNSQPKQRGTWYHITESNKGYRMLLRDGWNKDKGLGPEGKEGHKFPVKTVLKRDRRCLGAPKTVDSTPRVTHFRPYDASAVKKRKEETQKKSKSECSQSHASKRKSEKKQRKEREWEIEFRRSFSVE